ncbi:MAG: glycosyltransferase family 2 protein [Cyanobacteria bacterium CRU_2_1]|nr:glycosyltransferase family 2 protein [Cyanobacteria bacterium RU_5_0]NJR60480.1 glycosyltransferase family 2 protein [Cyanobacteria bacterium CRU_2_1]
MTHLSENQPKQDIEPAYPSFSIVFETENLSSVELENIYRSLASLDAQEISPNQANEFLIIDGGYAPVEVIEQLCAKYSWITVRSAPGISYHEAKMLGANLATGDIVVACDSDCMYEPNWLKNMLTPFQNSDVNVVAGETSTLIRNSYELAIAMNYLFPRFSNREEPYASKHYFLNGVAFRRDFLLQNPIPCDLPLYRGHCKIHTHILCNVQGHVIWKHPQARALHEPPTVSFISRRYFRMGCDSILIRRLNSLANPNQAATQISSTHSNRTLYSRVINRLKEHAKPEQALEVLREDKRRILMLPIAIPIILWFRMLFSLGRVTTYFQLDRLLKTYRNAIDESNKSAFSEAQNL